MLLAHLLGARGTPQGVHADVQPAMPCAHHRADDFRLREPRAAGIRLQPLHEVLPRPRPASRRFPGFLQSFVEVGLIAAERS